MPLIRAWRDLHDPELGDDVARLVGVLDRVASVRLEQRWPLLEAVSPWLTHSNPRVRSAALTATAGAAGPPTWEALNAALDDGDPHVREAALDAFAATAKDDPARWVLALLHEVPEVRQGAVARLPDSVHAWVWIRGLGDAETRAAIIARLMRAETPATLVRNVLEHVADAHIDRLQGAALVARADWVRGTAQLVRELGGVEHPTEIPSNPGEVVAWLAAGPEAPALDAAVDLLCDGVDAGVPECLRVAQELLDRALRDGLHAGIDIVARVLAEREIVLGRPLPRSLRTVMATLIPAVLSVLTDADAQSQVLRDLARFRRNGPWRTTLIELQLDRLVRRDAGRLDLRIAAGLAAVCEDRALVTLSSRFGALLIDAATRDPIGAALLLAPPKRGSPADGVRTQILRGVIGADLDAAALLLARLAIARPSLKLPRLDKRAADPLAGAIRLLDADARDGLLKPRAQQIIATTWAQSGLPKATLLRTILEHAAAPGPVSLCVLSELCGEVGSASVRGLPRALLKRLLALDATTPLLPWAVQQDLAVALAPSRDPELAKWAAEHAPKEAPIPAMPRSTGRRSLTPKEFGLIGGITPIEKAIAPALASPVTGLLRALRTRRPKPSPTVCAALLMCHDPLDEVAQALVEWGFEDPDVQPLVEGVLLGVARTRSDIGPAAGAVLFRWETAHDAFIAWFTAKPERPRQVLAAALALPSPTLRRALWSAARHLVGRWRWHEKERLRRIVADDEFIRVIVDVLGDRGGPVPSAGSYPHDRDDRDAVTTEAAGTLGRIATIRGLAPFRAEVEALRGDLPEAAQRALGKWLLTAGEVVPPPTEVGGGRRDTGDPESILAGTDGAALARLAASARRGSAELAVLRLVELGDWASLAVALLDPAGPHPDLVSETVPLWDEAALEPIIAAVSDPARPAPVRFHAALGLCERHGPGSVHEAAALEVASDSGSHFLRSSDVARLTAAVDDPDRAAGHLVRAPAFAAYHWAVAHLCSAWPARADAALRDFLLLGDTRVRNTRLDAARALRDHGDDTGLALVVTEAMGQARSNKSGAAVGWARGWSPPVVEEITRAAMRAGDRFAPSPTLVEGLFVRGVDRDAVEPACAAILEQAGRPSVQRRALDGLPTRLARTDRAQRLAHLFLWGRDQARKLLSRRFQIRYLVGDDLGLTRLEHRAIYVNPLPLLRGERNGAAVVRGLIVHELGHHLYNADPEGLRIWQTAQDQKLARLHNLVCDEHLERNLRGVDPAYGDDLKKLGAWAFLHARRTISVKELLGLLGSRTAAVLIPTPLAPARERGTVSLPLGNLFRALEAGGSSFSRFFRALRMGLGDRYDDPRVREALALFGAEFRDLDNPGLWEVTQKLAALFEGELGILDVADVHATSAGEEGDDPCHGKGVTNEDIQREVKRIEGTKDGINAKPKSGAKAKPRGPGPDTVNVGGDEAFNRIEHIQVLAHDPVEHASLARDVARDARHLRDAFAQLGLQHRWVGPRVRGTRLDRARLLGAALRGDPRVLRTRQRVFAADLHLSVVVDCSGSMHGERMERARRMATLLAEACRGLDGVDLRLFGFTDSTIYDAGDENRCAAHALEAGGGNNDAAGLHHAAQTALASPRAARLVVMISDGLPTECTTAALAGLVRHLQTRRQLACAQIAVAPLSERCFDTYLEVLDDDTAAAVRRFGALVTGLVANTLRG